MEKDLKKIHEFAVKWCNEFRGQNVIYIELVDYFMEDDCKTLGFELDYDDSFKEKYENDYEALSETINNITDIATLGTEIYSKWHYFNQQTSKGAKILESDNREWFVLALNRLAVLSGENPHLFQGTPKKIRIVSNNIGYGPEPDPNVEVEQHITINSKGQVWFSAYNYGQGMDRFEKARSKNVKIDKIAADKLLKAISVCFGREQIQNLVTDIGQWTMEFTNTEGITYKYEGSLCEHLDYEGTDLSDLIRDTVGMDDLYVFDGNGKPDVINKITLDYHRTTKVKSRKKLEGVECESITENSNERLVIDRETETLEHIQNLGTGCKIFRKYEMKGEIESLLEKFDADDLFTYIRGNPEDVIKASNETKDYRITIDYKREGQKIITGSFDKYGLPEDFSEFAKTVFNFVHSYDLGEIFNPSVYGKVKCRKSEYIYCSVMFENGGESYYYLTDDASIKVGDFVIVPAGQDNHEVIVKVVNIQNFRKENVPLAIEKTKKIICKYTGDEFDLLEE